MSFPVMPVYQPTSDVPTVAFCGYYFGQPTTLTNLGANNPNRVVVLAISSGGLTTGTVSIGGVSQTVWHPQADGTVLSSGSSYTQFIVTRVPTGTSVSCSMSMGTICMWYTITGLQDLVPHSGTQDASGTPSGGVVVMEEGSAIIANLYASNDNNSFTWTSPMIRTVNDTSVGPSRGASSAYRENTPAGAYSVSCAMGSGTMYMGAIVLR
jgi:hypothetical protein